MALADAVCEAGIAAEAHWEWYGQVAVEAEAFTVEAYPALRQLAYAAVDAAATLSAAPTRIVRAQAAATAGVEFEIAPDITRFALAAVDAVATVAADAALIGNPDARDPAERTMRRPFTDRTLRRPFVDRTMKATRI